MIADILVVPSILLRGKFRSWRSNVCCLRRHVSYLLKVSELEHVGRVEISAHGEVQNEGILLHLFGGLLSCPWLVKCANI